MDLTGRAICFNSGEPSGLSRTIHPVVVELRAICGPAARLLLGFDRGGSYPVCFAKLRDGGVDWVTYRRGALVEPTVAARSSWFNLDGRRHSYRIADETITLDGYGPARQISVYEHGQVVFQVLTSDTTVPQPVWCTCCAAGGGSRTPSNTSANTTASTPSATTR